MKIASINFVDDVAGLIDPNRHAGAAANAPKDAAADDDEGKSNEEEEYDGVDCTCDEWRDFQRRNSAGMEGFEEFIRAGPTPCPECAVGD